MTAKQVLALLEARHSKDIFVSEVTLGAQYRARRMDAWAFKPSWTERGVITGYEIKVTRSDFLADDKFQEYLGACHAFYFVTAPDVMQRDEVPPDAGLIVASKNCKRLHTVKRAPHRTNEIPEKVWRRVLMKLRYSEFGMPDHKPTADDWRKWLQDKTTNAEIGRTVSQYIASEVIEAFGKERERLDAANAEHHVGLMRLNTLVREGIITEDCKLREDIAQLLAERLNSNNARSLSLTRWQANQIITIADELKEQREKVRQ